MIEFFEPNPDRTLTRVRMAATALDDAIVVPKLGIRIGLDPILGMLPIAGDTVTGVVSLYIIVEGIRLGLPWRALLRMCFNVVVDVAIGSIPLLGDVFDAVWRSNRRNVTIIERHIQSESSGRRERF